MIDAKKPLDGRSVLVTRAEDQSREVVDHIQKLGGAAICFPMIEITGPDSWDACDDAVINLKNYSAVIFTSANAVRGFMTRIENKFPRAKKSLNQLTVYAVGDKTKSVLMNYGVTTDDVPVDYTAEALVEIIQNAGCAGKRFLLPAGNLTRDVIENGLQNAGAIVDRVQVYTTKKPGNIDTVRLEQLLHERSLDVITFFSPSSAHHFFEIIDPGLVQDIPVAVIGKTTYDAVSEYGIQPKIKPDESTGEELVNSIAQHLTRHNRDKINTTK